MPYIYTVQGDYTVQDDTVFWEKSFKLELVLIAKCRESLAKPQKPQSDLYP